MRWFRQGIILLIVTLVLGVLGGCGGQGGTGQQERTRLSIGTGGTGGTNYVIGGGIAAIINKYVPNVEAVAETTAGTVENVRLLLSAQAPMGIISYVSVQEEVKSKEERDRLRVLFNGHIQPLKLVTRAGSGINSYADLKGKRVSVGAAGSGTEVDFKLVLKMHGITYDNFSPVWLSFNEAAQALQDGTIDAAAVIAGDPTSSVTEVMTNVNCQLIPVDKNLVEPKLKEDEYRGFFIYEIPAGTYPKQDKPITTLALGTALMVRDDFPEDLAYQIAKALYEHNDELVATHTSGKDWAGTPDKMYRGVTLKFHPGTVKFLKEIGIWDQRPSGIE